MAETWIPKHVEKELAFTGELDKGMSGIQVQRLQEWLTFHGFATCVDAQFGDATAHCVAAFQKSRSLNHTGIVDLDTWRELTTPLASAVAPVGVKPGETFPEVVLRCARQHLAVHPIELGGDNRGVWVRTYMNGLDGKDRKWCAGFVTFLLKQACASLHCGSPIPGDFSCDVLAKQAVAAGRFVPETDLANGYKTWGNLGAAQIFLRRKSPNDWTHTGIAFEGAGKVYKTIEGNTNDDGSNNGYEVCSRTGAIVGKDFIVLT